MEVNIVLNIQVCTPVADLCCTAKRLDLKNGMVEIVMSRDRLLVFQDEISVHLNVVIRTIGNGCSRFCYRTIFYETVHVVWGSIGNDIRRRRSVMAGSGL